MEALRLGEAHASWLSLLSPDLTCPQDALELMASLVPNANCLSRLPTGTEARGQREGGQDQELGYIDSWRDNSQLLKLIPRAKVLPNCFCSD